MSYAELQRRFTDDEGRRYDRHDSAATIRANVGLHAMIYDILRRTYG